jgi:F1F0 ATPase subunit 2
MTAIAIAVAFGVGLALGVAYFTALRWNVRLYLTPGGRAAGIALHVGRLAAVTAVLWLAARAGAAPLLAVALGIVVSRPLAIRRPKGAR